MATYLPIKSNAKRGGYRAKSRSNTPARSSRTGRFLKGHKSNSPKKHHAPKRSNTHKAKRRSNVTWASNKPKRLYNAKKRGAGGRFKKGWSSSAKWAKGQSAWAQKKWGKRPKRKAHFSSSTGLRRAGAKANGPKIKYRTRTNVIHKTKRLRNPVGFDHADSLRSLGTWGKVGIGIVFGLGGLIVAFGVPKALAVVTGQDGFQRGWGGVATSALASLLAGLGVGMVSKRAGLGLLTAAGTGVALLVLNALHAPAAQAVIPVNEAVLAAMLPTFDAGGRGPADYLPGNARAGVPTQYRDANTPSAALALAQGRPASLPGGRGPSDFNTAMRGAMSSEAIGREPTFHSRALAPKERF